ncbi:hypothetical protein E4T63_05010 [Pseudomonas fluorescens]|uniref:Uncharacterized protein n=2 Tax=Pseudomonas TaxID=286 RepID=A0A2C5WDV0_PSEPU|nr:hypothetical protein CRX57_21010 [Pseudomonas putida]QBR30408.1 hypothetical protein E3Z29_07555 [Pseudomonas sp. S150]QBX39976.1 hypothetical protein E4T63_05010 [Pseudomonas fluorescens]
MWERACSRRGRIRQRICRMTYRLREQARSHRGSANFPILRATGDFHEPGRFHHHRRRDCRRFHRFLAVAPRQSDRART